MEIHREDFAIFKSVEIKINHKTPSVLCAKPSVISGKKNESAKKPNHNGHKGIY